MKLLAIIGLALMCVIAISEAHGNGRNGKNIAQKYGQSKYNGLRSRKFGGGYGVGKKVPTNYQGYQGRLGPYQYRLGRYRFGNYRYGRYGHQYRLGYRRYGQKNSLGYGYKKGSAFYDEKEQDASGITQGNMVFSDTGDTVKGMDLAYTVEKVNCDMAILAKTS